MPPRNVGPYGKLLANYAADDAIIAAGEAAELLFCRAIAWLSTSDSDGYMTEGQVIRYVGAGMRDALKRADALVKHGLWVRVDGGYQMRSYLKINESAEEKGRKRRTDRERKQRDRHPESERSPNGHATDSARNPPGVTPDSLTVLSTSVSTEVQSKEVQSTAVIPLAKLAPTAQTIVAEWLDRTTKRPPDRVIGQIAKLASEMLAEGIDPNDVRRGLAAWMAKNLHPSTLPAVVHEVMNTPAGIGKATAKAAGWLNLETSGA